MKDTFQYIDEFSNIREARDTKSEYEGVADLRGKSPSRHYSGVRVVRELLNVPERIAAGIFYETYSELSDTDLKRTVNSLTAEQIYSDFSSTPLGKLLTTNQEVRSKMNGSNLTLDDSLSYILKEESILENPQDYLRKLEKVNKDLDSLEKEYSSKESSAIQKEQTKLEKKSNEYDSERNRLETDLREEKSMIQMAEDKIKEADNDLANIANLSYAHVHTKYGSRADVDTDASTTTDLAIAESVDDKTQIIFKRAYIQGAIRFNEQLIFSSNREVKSLERDLRRLERERENVVGSLAERSEEKIHKIREGRDSSYKEKLASFEETLESATKDYRSREEKEAMRSSLESTVDEKGKRTNRLLLGGALALSMGLGAIYSGSLSQTSKQEAVLKNLKTQVAIAQGNAAKYEKAANEDKKARVAAIDLVGKKEAQLEKTLSVLKAAEKEKAKMLKDHKNNITKLATAVERLENAYSTGNTDEIAGYQSQVEDLRTKVQKGQSSFENAWIDAMRGR